MTDEVHGSIHTGGGVKEFAVYFHVAKFDNERMWTVKRIIVDGKTAYESGGECKMPAPSP